MTLLRALVDDPPPLVPEPALASARATYERFRTMPPSHAREVEDAIIAYGRILWPYRKAFDVLVRTVLEAEGITAATPCADVVAAHARVREQTRAAITADPHEYRKHIRAFQELQHALEEQIAALRRLAERAADHPDVFAEITETVRTFERGLAALAREPAVREVCAAIEAYRERHEAARDRRVRESRPRIFR